MRKKGVRPTITDIAKDVGVSITTVSLVLNNKAARIPPATREKVLAAAEKFNYRPYQGNGSLNRGSKTVGIIVSDIGNAEYSKFSAELVRGCSDAGKTALICSTNSNQGKALDYIQLLSDTGVGGIVYGPQPDGDHILAEKIVKTLQQSQIPFVLVNEETTTIEILRTLLGA
ncbi:MAG: LacI family transcriptional regulator [Lachnospiraceae bacterium]|jgi:LacI family transcriptional regulator|nr:LacI family transcriptional regulator [Lachnospiraceae bacterium]